MRTAFKVKRKSRSHMKLLHYGSGCFANVDGTLHIGVVDKPVMQQPT